MPAYHSFGPYDGDRIERRAKEPGGDGEYDAMSRSEAGPGHRTLQHDDLLGENDVFGDEGGTELDDLPQSGDLNKHRGEMPTTRRSLDEFRGNCGEFELSDRVFAANKCAKTLSWSLSPSVVKAGVTRSRRLPARKRPEGVDKRRHYCGVDTPFPFPSIPKRPRSHSVSSR
jgi:hypothetical protein